MESPVVLIVDDEQNIRETVAQALEGLTPQILKASTIAETWGILAEHHADAMFLDLKLPDGNGLDMLRTLQLNHPDIIPIVMTAYGTVDSAVEAMRYGAADFLQKPFSPKTLRQSLISAMELRRNIQPPVDERDRLRMARSALGNRAIPMAEEQIRAVIAKNPMSAPGFNLLGAIREITGEAHQAQLYYRIATTVDRNYAPAQSNLDRLAMWPPLGQIDLGSEESDHAKR